MKQYDIGDGVWVASFETREERVPCPVCYGNKQVMLILGNGDEVITPCAYCQSGFDQPKGYEIVYQKLPRVDYKVITNIKVEKELGKEKIAYQGGRYILRIDNMFDTEDEALAHAEKLAEEENINNANKPKYKNEKSYSWNAGYHLRSAERCRREAQYHEEKAKICKSKSKEK